MDAPTPTTRDVLTEAEAQQRAGRVSRVSYDLALDLTRGTETYRGAATIRFRLLGDAPVFLDFTGRRIASLTINGHAIAEPEWTGTRLTLHGHLEDEQHDRENVVHVVYENEYDHTGDGFHQFIDPEDGQEYLYTNFEPYSAHRLMPCFDQPDLKARYRLTVDAPADWTLIANAAAERTEALADGRERTMFAETLPFSTYLFALIAGPYEVFRARHGEIDLAFYARRSLAPHIDEDELFEITKQGLDFYADFFEYPYPFGKYDQVFVPEFNAGAMENVAAITHSERLVFRDPPTENDRLGRAEVILHEMAHMWFGDLVTMRWWNDLWLNESFATYMAYLALTSATRFTTGWQAFNSGMKNWAYRQDQLVTTHPIAGVVADTDQTFQNFDGITYGKGASVIKQLVAAIGIDGFRRGMRTYFRRHEFGNTTLAEWLDALGHGAGRDLTGWAQAWLETPSLNTLAATVQRDGERIAGLTLAQSAPADYPTLRPHHVEVALLRDEGGRLAIDSVPATIDGARAEVPGAVGRPAPDFVFPNYNDHAFAKIALDRPSLDFVRSSLERIDDALLRQLIWQTLWNMVRDQQLKSTEYLELAAPKVAAESDKELVETILSQMSATVARFVPEEQKAAQAHRLFQVCADALLHQTDPDLQIIWARTLIGVAISPDDIRHCADLADGRVTVPGLTIDQEMRWGIAARYVAYGLDGAAERFAAERERDPSDRGQRAALRCEVSAPDEAVKQDAWERFQRGPSAYGSLHLTGAAMGGFHWWVQQELLAPYVERFFEVLPGIYETQEREFASTFFGGLWPTRVDRAILQRAQRLLAETPESNVRLRRSLREAIDDLERAVKCREFAAS